MIEDLIREGLAYVQRRQATLEAKRDQALAEGNAVLTDEEIDELAALKEAEVVLIRQQARERRDDLAWRNALARGREPAGSLGAWVASGKGRLAGARRRPDTDHRGLNRIRRALDTE